MSAATELILVAAVADNGVIGRGGAMPWRLPEDLKRFRRLTWGKTLLMGRRTFASLGRPLPGRENWVLTRDRTFAPPGVRVFHSIEAALAAAPAELYVIGGAELYRQTLPSARRIELTEVHGTPEGDTHFPAFDRRRWRETEREDHPADARHSDPYSFVSLVRA
jgi:dihydrofolate reductase